ncbi:cytochrome P450 [Xylaria nigripes]|nr:cytochrome P450 [Xylaria nigripes]
MAIWDLDPTLGVTALAVPSVYLVWSVISTIKSWWRLRHIPGPIFASVSYLWGYFAVTGGFMHHRLLEVQEKYGRLIRIGPNELLVGDAQSIWKMNSVRGAYGRGAWYNSMKIDPYGHHVLSERDTAKHDKRRAKLAAGYSGKGVVDLEGIVDSQINVLVDLLKSRYLAEDGPKIVDFSRFVLYFQVDVVSRAAFGESWGNLPNLTDHYDFISTTETFIPWIESFVMLPFLRELFASPLFLKLAGPKITDKKGLGKFLGFVYETVRKRFEESADIPNLGDTLLDEWISHGLTRRESEIELALVLPAGTETASTAMRAIFLYILSSPKQYQKLQDEIMTSIQEGRISNPVTNNEAKQLPYLQAVINEGIRMVPPLITGFAKRVPPGGDTLCGQFVPEGTDVFVNTMAIMRNTEVFGEDADIFRPERFLEASAERRAEMLKHVDIVFGHGRWGCPGQMLARLEMNKFIVEILRRCDLQIVNPHQPWLCRGYVSMKIDDFFVRFSKKEEAS